MPWLFELGLQIEKVLRKYFHITDSLDINITRELQLQLNCMKTGKNWGKSR